MRSLVRSWNCRKCGRYARTAVSRDGTGKCEYCTDTAEVSPVHPWGPMLIRFASSLLSFLTKESGCVHWRPVLAPARVWRLDRWPRGSALSDHSHVR